jgi:hypothetical protein
MRRSRWTALVAATLALTVVESCASAGALRRNLLTPAEVALANPQSPYLKAHMRSGDVFILSGWQVDSIARTVTGTGQRFDRNRQPQDSSATHVLALDSVALFESNVVTTHGSISALAILTVASTALTVACISNPKACFGSCPTFYIGEGTEAVLEAEGFSASVAPSLEATDIDALYRARPSSARFSVRMTNEALETHVVRWVRLLAVPRAPGDRVFATQSGDFWSASDIVSPARCAAADGDCVAAVRALDAAERFTASDATDLAAREVIELEFPEIRGDTVGLVIGSRQTLLSTFLLYQTLAYMGRNASAWLAALEQNDAVRGRANALGDVLGGIEVQAQDARGRWKTVGETRETGPLATDVRVVPLTGLRPGTTRLRLRLTRGHWRIDYLALARLDRRVEPVVLDPVRVKKGGADDPGALALLRDTTRPLVTFPGDDYTFEYELPEPFASQELFLQSRGYYLEWMRAEWLAEENPARAAAMFMNPRRAMRELAPAFKKQEAGMERAFWDSRYVRH